MMTDIPNGSSSLDDEDEMKVATSSEPTFQNGMTNGITYHPTKVNPAKHDEWNDLGRFLSSSQLSDNSSKDKYDLEAAIERNSCMLEDLLATALEYDAILAKADETTTPNNNSVPQEDGENFTQQQQDDKIHILSPTLRAQIRKYVTQISNKYHNVGFHSFEHASHVMLSATKIVYMLQSSCPFNTNKTSGESPMKNRIDNNRGGKTETGKGEEGDDNMQVGNSMDEMDQQESTQPKTLLHNLTNTIYDPWLHFAIAFSALLHDVDHKGLPNNQLHIEKDILAYKYGSVECMKSYAEWNSLDIGLSLFNRNGPSTGEDDGGRGEEEEEEYGEFASVLGGLGGQERFYKMVTDLVLCTDIASKERRELGMKKWEKACCFIQNTTPQRGNLKKKSSSSWRNERRWSMETVVTQNTRGSSGSLTDNKNEGQSDVGSVLKLYTPEAAKAISEQIMQVADVSHTMQHFTTFTKWNSHLYHEVLAAYQCGRTTNTETSHPKESWYESQIGFFDHYIIPLAERLDASGLFAEAHKFAPLAVNNKEQWIEEGRECTRLMVEEAEGMELPPPMPVVPHTSIIVNDGGEGGIINMEKVRNKMSAVAIYEEGGEGEMSSILDDSTVESSSIVPMAEEDDDDSIQGRTVETATSRVSFAGGSRASRRGSESLARYERRRSSNFSRGNDVDSSVNAIVPHILVQQLINSLQHDVQNVPDDQKMNSLRGAVSKYQTEGSIRRHRGALLFVDISGFTKLSQNYPVEDFKTFINQYFTKIINLVNSFGGEIVKFAGDAVYVIWNSERTVDDDATHAMNIEKSTACAIAINAECNNYKVSKSYNRRSSVVSSNKSTRRGSVMSESSGNSSRSQGEVLYRYQDKNAEYEERGAVLNVYCGVSEGIMAGIDVVANSRAEFFLVGRPLKDVAKAENLAGPGELVVSPSVYDSLKKGDSMSIASKLLFTNADDGSNYQKVLWPNHPTVDGMLSYFKEKERSPVSKKDAQSLIENLIQSSTHSTPKDTDSLESASLQSDLMHLLECHRHEAARDVVGKFTAEIRQVVIIFISIKYEPELPEDHSEDNNLLENFQSIYSIISESVSSRSGQVRQFINDDKGTVFIASFGLRGSVLLHPSDTAVDAAIQAQKKLLEIMGIQSSIGITLGKIFCGETGSFERYEYSLLGPSVNLSARLMAKGSWGQINCDEELKNHTGRRHTFTISGTHKLKGYEMPVPFFMPTAQEESAKKNEEQDDIISFMMQREEATSVVDKIIHTRKTNGDDPSNIKPYIILIRGDEGKGKDAFISGILMQPDIQKSSLILEANRCFHDDPFYCFIPIITRAILSFVEPRERLISLKKRHKRSSVLAAFVANPAFQSSAFPRGTDIVPNELMPYLSLVNDFVFKGFPLMKSSLEVKKLRENEKVQKVIEVLSALILRFVELNERPAILSMYEMDSIDSYSKKLLSRILSSDANLLILGGATDSPVQSEVESSPEDSVTTESFLTSILGEESHIHVERMDLELLDKSSTFDLFQWSLRRDFSKEECRIIDHPDVHEKLFQLCGGMTHATARLANTFCTQYQKDKEDVESKSDDDFLEYMRLFLDGTPTDFEEIIWYRIDQMKPEEQMLLKIASVAGFDQYSFSQNLLETVLLAVSRSENASMDAEDSVGGLDEEEDEFRVPSSVGGDVPTSVGISDESQFSYIFQGDYFEQILDSLVAHNFLDEVNVEMSDLSSMDAVIYRFRNNHERKVINDLMLNDQKKRTHFEVAAYYSASFHRSGGGDSWGENDSSSLSTDITSVSNTNWEVFHVIALHYDLAEVPIPAMLHYYDSSASLASLGVRDKAHGRLLSAYLMLEKILHQASSLDVKVEESLEQRRHIAGQMIRTIGGDQLKDNVKVLTKLTKEHLRVAFDGDIFAFKKSLVVLQKFGQSVGTIEKEGYLFGSELYIQAILLLLLVLEDDTLTNLTSSLDSFLGLEKLGIAPMKGGTRKDESPDDSSSVSSGDSCFQDLFDIDDLSISFPAFSGLLTFYRDSPIGANQVQETFLANLFVAVTEEANQMIHVLRTKCILSHLYLKHGNITKALEECEDIKEIYDHDRYSLELVNTYGMDWPLVCVATMASTYLFKGKFIAARRNIEFLKTQMIMLDEFASSTKAMSKGTISSFYLLLYEFENAAEIASGINATQYGYFFKAIGTLQEELANRELALYEHKTFDSVSVCDVDLLSILSSDDVQQVNHNRPMLEQSAETLSDRGIEAVRAALCETEIRNLELQLNHNADTVKKQIQYCEAGLAYLRQSLGQNDANNHERRKNYLLCLYQQTNLLCWHDKLLRLLKGKFGIKVEDILGINGSEREAAKASLDECRDLSLKYEYPFMQLLAGKRYIKLDLDVSGGEDLIQRSMECMNESDREVAKTILSRIDQVVMLSVDPSPIQQEVPSAA